MSPTPEPQGVYEDEEDEEPPNSLTMGFDHTRRWERPSGRDQAGWEDLDTRPRSGDTSSNLVLPLSSRRCRHKALELRLRWC